MKGGVDLELTKNADKLLCFMYKIFLDRKKLGQSQHEARKFIGHFYESDENLSRWPKADVDDALMELGKSGYLRITIGPAFELTDLAIIKLENRFKNGVKDLLSFISQFVP